MSRAALVGLAWLAAAGAAPAAVRMDAMAGTWRDEFTDLSGLDLRQQAAIGAPAGLTVDAAEQNWSQPYAPTGVSELFSTGAPTRSAGVELGNPGSGSEQLTLWSRVYEPGVGMKYCSTCEVGQKGEVCPLNNLSPYFRNGDVATLAINNIPQLDPTTFMSGVGWDETRSELSPGGPTVFGLCRSASKSSDGTPVSPAINACGGDPLVHGISEKTLVAGEAYLATFTVAANLTSFHIGHSTTPYLVLDVEEEGSKLALGCTTLYEGQFLTQSVPTTFRDFTPVSVFVDPLPAVSSARWDPRVYPSTVTMSPVGHPHCTVLGPVWLTAQRGLARSRVFDSLADGTQWTQVCWTLDMSTMWTDSAASPIPAGSPITPVTLTYAAANTAAPVLPPTGVVQHGGETAAGVIGRQMVLASCTTLHDAGGGPVTGRYFQWTARLFGRATASEVDSDLAPVPSPIYFGGLRPTVKNVTVRYLACAAEVTSRRIAPPSVAAWGTLSYAVDLPSAGAAVVVDVLAEDGTVLLAGAASGAPLTAISPWQHPALRLRARLTSDPADCGKRPVLRAWQVTWTPQVDVIAVACNAFRPDRGETCPMELKVERAGPARVEILDAAGQRVVLLLDGELPAEARMIAWDGRTADGRTVAPGAYFVVARVPGGVRTRTLAVLR